MKLQDLINQFTEDLEFKALCDWAVMLGIEISLEEWYDDEFPDREAELRVKVAEAMSKIGESK